MSSLCFVVFEEPKSVEQTLICNNSVAELYIDYMLEIPNVVGGIMKTTLPKLKLSDLYEGMRVYKEQLSDIYDIWIIIYRPKGMMMSEDGIIGFIGSEPNEKSDALYTDNNIIIPVYEGDIFDEE